MIMKEDRGYLMDKLYVFTHNLHLQSLLQNQSLSPHESYHHEGPGYHGNQPQHEYQHQQMLHIRHHCYLAHIHYYHLCLTILSHAPQNRIMKSISTTKFLSFIYKRREHKCLVDILMLIRK